MGRDPENPVFQFVPISGSVGCGPSVDFGTNVPCIRFCDGLDDGGDGSDEG